MARGGTTNTPAAATWQRLGINGNLAILPYMDQAPLFNQYDSSVGVTHPNNRAVIATHLPAFICPSDPYATSRNRFVGMDDGNGNATMARGNYAMSAWGGNGWWNVLWQNYGNSDKGIYGPNSGCRLQDIVDGSSNTVAYWEMRAGNQAADPRGVWASGRVGGSLLGNCLNPGAGIGTGDCFGINDRSTNGDDVFVPAPQPNPNLNDAQFVAQGISGFPGGEGQAGSKSTHTGGVHVLLADGSVRFVSQNVDGVTHRRLIAIYDGNAIAEF